MYVKSRKGGDEQEQAFPFSLENNIYSGGARAFSMSEGLFSPSVFFFMGGGLLYSYIWTFLCLPLPPPPPPSYKKFYIRPWYVGMCRCVYIDVRDIHISVGKLTY